MNITDKFKACLALCRKRQRLIALFLFPLVFAGCASYNIKGGYFDAAERNTTFPTSVSGVTPSNLPIYTKIAGVSFDLDILAGFYMTDNTSIQQSVSGTYASGDANIDLVDLSAPGCSSACSGSIGDGCQVSGVTIGSPTTHAYGGGVGSSGSGYYYWNGGEQGRKTYFTFLVPQALGKAKVRLYGKACYNGSCQSATMCSTDSFTVRPASFTITSTPASGATQAAGSNYTMTAKAVSGSGATITGYTGTPSITTTGFTDWKPSAISAGSFTGSFSAAVAGIASGSNFNYTDFGQLTIPAGAIADNTYVANSGSGDVAGNDCISGSSSNTLSGGQYGCNIGNTSTTTPTFIAHHYTATHTITPACNSKFTYFGQPLTYAVTIDAFNALGNRMTRLTSSASGKPTFTFSQLNSGAATINPLSISSPTWAADSTFGTANGGEYALSATSTATTRPAGLSSVSAAPPSYESFQVRVTSSDANITTCNGVAAAGTTTCDSAATKLRYGVLKLSDGQGTSVSPASLQIAAQYWNGSSFVTNTDDVCTVVNFNAGTIAASTLPRPTAKNTSTTLSNGVGALMLNATAANNVAIKMGAVDNNCVLATSSVGTPLNALSGYLGSASCSSSYDKDPSARLTFGTLRSPYVYRAEKF
ncbi:MAG: hypothetical protein EPO09_02505 [Aquabacterium sp.]|uniref:DUF6701 domain-containing protein n=1 Tax=Aquabacterium sp. TaxID=1872578 RepID=UPI001203C067|nr:DUF6701 domain-containing protein [Aquabacterium sp.]TAK98327.1 MAG: hypothetical protein EPO09_02505 [Aquabacterium sp.]